MTVLRLVKPFLENGAERVYLARSGLNLFVGRKPPIKNKGLTAQLEVLEIDSTEPAELRRVAAALTS